MTNNYENDNMEIQDDQQEDTKEQEEQPQKKQPKYHDEDVQRIVQERLRQANQKREKERAEYEAKIRDYESKLAATSSGAKPAGEEAPAMGNQQQPGQISEQDLPRIIEHHNKLREFNDKLQQAIQEDNEFKDLTKTGNYLPPEVTTEMMHLDNAAAVIKHLLKDKNDYRLLEQTVMDAVNSKQKYGFVKFVNELSAKLEKVDKKPGPSEYTPSTNLTDVGEGGEDFDTTEYVKNYHKMRGK